jgi:hypothetical protein
MKRFEKWQQNREKKIVKLKIKKQLFYEISATLRFDWDCEVYGCAPYQGGER